VSLTLLLLVTGCARTQTVYKTNTAYRNPPAFLLADCPVPEYTGTDWQDVAEYAKAVQVMLDLCNGDKAMLREWVSQHE
jgi:hypothetical protein